MPQPRLRLLFVCTVNRMRSATAHELYREDARFEVNSAGTFAGARQVITRELLEWADAVVVMEKHHRDTIRQQFPDVGTRKKMVCLYIPDEYGYMQPALQALLRDRVEELYRQGKLG